MASSKKDLILRLFKGMEVVRPRDAAAIGIAGSYLNALHNKGVLERPSRGLYTLPNSEPSEFRSIVEACKLSPNATVCLLSALRVHDLTTQSPYEVCGWQLVRGIASHRWSIHRFELFASRVHRENLELKNEKSRACRSLFTRQPRRLQIVLSIAIRSVST